MSLGATLDRITSALLTEFAASFGIEKLDEPDQFERFSSYLATRRHYSEAAFDPSDIATGSGGDTGIDGIAIVVNNNLVTDVGTVEDLVDVNGYLDVSFIFIQSETSSGFDTAKIGQFAFGVKDFFGAGKLPRNEAVSNAVEIMEEIYRRSGKFSKGNPSCFLYYATTGKWNPDDGNLNGRAEAEVDDLRATGLFSRVEFRPMGADDIQRLYNQSKNAITREFDFENRTVIAGISDVKEAHLGFMSASDFLKLVCDETGSIIESLFYENVRGWHGYNQINSEIRATLASDFKDKFVIMNNGVTIIAKTMFVTAHRFTITDFQIVNGCQTSHILFDNQDLIDDSVRIPVRLISTQDEAVFQAIITATNRQTEVKQDQFFALKGFAKKVEAFFSTFNDEKSIYYERRSHQYDSQAIEKVRIVTHQNLVRAMGAIVLREPHRTARNYRSLSMRVGKDIFVEGHKLEPYYMAAYALYKLEGLFRSRRLGGEFKSARYHILMTAILSLDAKPLRPLNANDTERRAKTILAALWKDADGILLKAAETVRTVAQGNLDRDNIRTEKMTEALLSHFGINSAKPKEPDTVAAGE